MQSIWSTGNHVVDEVSALAVTGNVIPEAWYRTVTRPNGKPDLTAIIILADIVYWYRAGEQRDEGTGEVVRRYARFAADKLQRSYRQIADRFGIGKDEARNAVERLAALGVITRELRTIQVGGKPMSNVLFLEIVPSRLRELTYPTETPGLAGRVENSTEIGDTVSRNVENSPENAKAGLADVENSVENSEKEGGVGSKTDRGVGTKTDTYTETTDTEIKDLKTLGSGEPSRGQAARRVLEGHTACPGESDAAHTTSQGYEWSHSRGAYVRSRRLESLPSYPDVVECFACGCGARKAAKAPSCRTYQCDSCGAVWTEPAVSAPQSPQIGDFEGGLK